MRKNVLNCLSSSQMYGLEIVPVEYFAEERKDG
nr:MAG TPA: hypothetical protein [Caudoviricetes sp.]DAV60548.1 MAG TPA: hypothetical protein [Caudoviricetes sp.]